MLCKIDTQRKAFTYFWLKVMNTDEQDLLSVIIHTLGRIDEVLRLRWEDVNFEKRLVTLWTRKQKDGAYESDSLPRETTCTKSLRIAGSHGRKKHGYFSTPQQKKALGIGSTIARK